MEMKSDSHMNISPAVCLNVALCFGFTLMRAMQTGDKRRLSEEELLRVCLRQVMTSIMPVLFLLLSLTYQLFVRFC